MYQKILIAIDDSRYTLNVIKKGFELSNQLNTETALLYAIDTSKNLGEIDANIYPKEAINLLKKEANITVKKIIDKYNGKVSDIFIPIGNPTRCIIDTADSWKADLIIVGSHGKSSIKKLFLGSVSQYVSLKSKVPVLIIPVNYV